MGVAVDVVSGAGEACGVGDSTTSAAGTVTYARVGKIVVMVRKAIATATKREPRLTDLFWL